MMSCGVCYHTVVYLAWVTGWSEKCLCMYYVEVYDVVWSVLTSRSIFCHWACSYKIFWRTLKGDLN